MRAGGGIITCLTHVCTLATLQPQLTAAGPVGFEPVDIAGGAGLELTAAAAEGLGVAQLKEGCSQGVASWSGRVGHPEAGLVCGDWPALKDSLSDQLYKRWLQARWPAPMDRLATLPGPEAKAEWLWAKAVGLGLASPSQVADFRKQIGQRRGTFEDATRKWTPAVEGAAGLLATDPADYGGAVRTARNTMAMNSHPAGPAF